MGYSAFLMGSSAVDFKGKINGSWVCEFSVKQVDFQPGVLVGLLIVIFLLKLRTIAEQLKGIFHNQIIYINQVSKQTQMWKWVFYFSLYLDSGFKYWQVKMKSEITFLKTKQPP